MAKLIDSYKRSQLERAVSDYVPSTDWMMGNDIACLEASVNSKGVVKYEVNGKKMSSDEFVNKYGASMTVDVIAAAAMTTTDEEVMDVINKLSTPESMTREEAGEFYEESLGYNPTNYYDKRELSCLLDLAEDKADFKLTEEDHDQILTRAMSLFEEDRKSNQLTALRKAVAESEISDKLTSTISTMIGSMITDDDDDYDLDEIEVDLESEDDDFDLVDSSDDDDDDYDD